MKALFTSLILIAWLPNAFAGGWTQDFGGAGRSRVSETTHVFESFRRQWAAPIQGVAESLVSNEVTAFAALDPKNNDGLILRAINIHSGQSRWEKELFAERSERGPASLGIFEDDLFLWTVLDSGSGRLYRFDRHTGELLAEKRVTTFDVSVAGFVVTETGVFVLIRKLDLEMRGYDRETLAPLFPSQNIVSGIGQGFRLTADEEHVFLAYNNRFEARSQSTGDLAWHHEADREHAFIDVEGQILGGEVLLSEGRAAVISAGGLWMLDLETRRPVWESRLGPSHGARAFDWPQLYLGGEGSVRLVDAVTGAEIDQYAAPALSGFVKQVTGLVVTPGEVFTSRSGITEVRDRQTFEKTGELPFGGPIIAGDVLMGRDLKTTTGVLTFYPAVDPPRLLNGLSVEGVAGSVYEQPLLTRTATAPAAQTAEILRGPAWLDIEPTPHGEWTLRGVPDLDSAGEHLVVLRFTRDGLAFEHTHRLTVRNPGPPSVTLAAASTAPPRGSSLEILAQIRGGRPVSVAWFKDGVPLDREGESLFLSNLQPEDSGLYTARVTNDLGTTLSEAWNVEITGGPVEWSAGIGDPSGRNAVAVEIPDILAPPLWRFVQPDLEGSPSTGWGMAFWLSSSGDPLVINAAALESGERLWSKTIEGTIDQAPVGVYRGREHLFLAWTTHDGSTHVRALHPASGQQRWELELPSSSGRSIGSVAPLECAMLNGDLLVWQNVSVADKPRLVLLEAATGKEKGAIALPATLRRRPKIAVEGETLLVCYDGTLEAFDAASLESQWVDHSSLQPRTQRIAIQGPTVICQRGDGLEAFDRASGEPLWHVKDRDDPFAITGDYLYTGVHRLLIRTGESQFFMDEAIQTRGSWRFASLRDLFFEDLNDQLQRIDLARAQVSKPGPWNERPRAIAGNYIVTQGIGSSGQESQFQVYRLDERRIASEPPTAAARGASFSYVPDVRRTNGDLDNGFQLHLDDAPDWLSVSADGKSITGTPPSDAEGRFPVILRAESASADRVYQSFTFRVLGKQPEILLAPRSLRLVPGESHPWRSRRHRLELSATLARGSDRPL